MPNPSFRRKRGRRPIYGPKEAQAILDYIASGGTLTQICKQPGMPSPQLVVMWAVGSKRAPQPGFGEAYALARRRRYELWEDQLIDLADGAVDLDSMPKVQGRRLAVDTRKWIMSKRAPDVWGEQVLHQLSGTAQVNIYLPQKGAVELPPPTIDGTVEQIEDGQTES
jgi:hypothetical protein